MGQTCNSTVQLGIAAAVFCSFLACFSGINHIADLFVQFRLQMAVALLPMVLYLACTFKIHPAPKLLAFSLVALILNAVCVLWTTISFNGAGPMAGGGLQKGASDLRVLDFNIHNSNEQYAVFMDYARLHLPDVICLQEYTPQWQARLALLRKDYPYCVSLALEDPFGIAILSRTPFVDSGLLHLGKAGVSSAYAQIEFKGETWAFLATHPYPPSTMPSYNLRNEQFQRVAEYVKKLHCDHVVLAGDLNCAPWSAHFINLLSSAGLVDTRLGFGLGESWPVKFWPLRIPIDHVLVSKNVITVARRVEPDLGSDHLPVYVELRSRK